MPFADISNQRWGLFEDMSCDDMDESLSKNIQKTFDIIEFD